ncbi:MAG: M23 family metallopeptidase [Vicinamibacteria bacterium]
MEHRTRTHLRTWAVRLTTTSLALFALATSARAQSYDPPIWADNLTPDQRLFNVKAKHSPAGHPQEWGQDIVGVRHTGGRSWSRQHAGAIGTNNATYVIYNKPVYAMGPGTVIACWRNAPPNPRAGEQHPEVAGRRIALGGNFLWIEEDDGDRVLYAHAIAGSIPSALCPNDATLLPTPYALGDDQMPVQTHLSIFNRPRVESGDLLMRAGNSGNSSEPHLHIHKIDAAGAAEPMIFRRGLYSVWTNDGASYDDWSSFAGNAIPAQTVVIWPPRRRLGEAAGHGHVFADYRRVALHLRDSGFRPYTLDTYSVGGTSFINFAWRPSDVVWRASTLVDEGSYVAHIESDEAQGWDPVLIESSTGSGGQVLYSVVSVKNLPGTWLARHGMLYDEHIDVMSQAAAAGLSPVSISVVSVQGERRYTVLYRPVNIGGWEVKSQVREADFQAMVDAQEQAGRYPVYVNAYMHQGTAYLSAIFASIAGSLNHSAYQMSAAEYQTEYEEWVMQNGLDTRSVTSFDGAQQQHRFAAVWTNP